MIVYKCPNCFRLHFSECKLSLCLCRGCLTNMNIVDEIKDLEVYDGVELVERKTNICNA